MKLKTKLLPLLAVGATASVVTPLMVSCKGASTSNPYEIYIPTIPKAVSSRALTPAEATTLYGDHLLVNSEILMQDIKCYDSYVAQAIYDDYLVYNGPIWATDHAPIIDIQTKISNLSVEFTKAAQATFLYPTLSFDLTGKINLDGNQGHFGSDVLSPLGDGAFFHQVSIDSFNFHVQNLPIALRWIADSGGAGHWEMTSPIHSYFVSSLLYPWTAKCEIGNTTVIATQYTQSFTRDAQTYTLSNDNLPETLNDIDRRILSFVLSKTIGMEFVYHMSDIIGGDFVL